LLFLFRSGFMGAAQCTCTGAVVVSKDDIGAIEEFAIGLHSLHTEDLEQCGLSQCMSSASPKGSSCKDPLSCVSPRALGAKLEKELLMYASPLRECTESFDSPPACDAPAPLKQDLLLYVLPDGSSYTGEWCGESRHGQGMQVWPDGSKYSGQWQSDSFHGSGEHSRADGSNYVGQFKAGKAHGRGTLTSTDGAQYEGDWCDNAFHGVGTHRWKDGRCFKGQWVQGEMQGTGIFTWPDGRTYEGEYMNGFKEGFGIFTWPDGSSYEGEWKACEKDGEGLVCEMRKCDAKLSSGSFTEEVLQ